MEIVKMIRKIVGRAELPDFSPLLPRVFFSQSQTQQLSGLVYSGYYNTTEHFTI